jgi:hypothetical protein
MKGEVRAGIAEGDSVATPQDMAMKELARISKDISRTCHFLGSHESPKGRFAERSEWAACMAFMMQAKAGALVDDPIIDGVEFPEWAIAKRVPPVQWMEGWLSECGFRTTFSEEGPMGWTRKGEATRSTLRIPCGYRTNIVLRATMW